MTGNGLHQPDKNNEWVDVAISEYKLANKEKFPSRCVSFA
jgi:hypothetical protein